MANYNQWAIKSREKPYLVDFDFSIDGAIKELEATPEIARKALNSTMGKMAAWMRVQSIRGLSDKLKIQQKILRSRIKRFRVQNSLSWANSGEPFRVWYGLNDIPFSRLKPRQRKNGVAAMGGRFVEGAFIAELYGRPQVLKRLGKARVPLEVQYASIEDPSKTYIEDFVLESARFEQRFMELFMRELKWRTSTQA